MTKRRRNIWLVVAGAATALVPSTFLFFSVNMLFVVPLVVGVACTIVGVVPMSPQARRRATLLGFVVCAFSGIGLMALTAFPERTGHPIRIVLPRNFTGKFSIIRDRKRGRDLVMRDDVWVLVIPQNGELRVKDDSPFFKWHKEEYTYDDGTPAEVESLGTIAGSTDYHGTTHQWRVLETRQPTADLIAPPES